MAKKNEFKPDKPRSGFFSKLYLTQKQRRTLLKWFLYGAILLVLSVLQDVILCRLSVFSATTDLLPSAIFLICVLEGMESGSVFSLVASLLYLFSGTAPGAYCVVFITVLSVIATAFRQGYLQKGFSAAALCTLCAAMVYEMAVFLFGLFLGLTTPARAGAFLLTGILSAAAVLALYPIFLSVGRIGGEAWKE